ncbi:MAG: exodeoxyribonuclease VII large subunit, partial [Xanthomonadaceae bacterium]|nr:exodeoxyribonuclease VII large subunit [Xanthomonadaceae bacterium]
LEQRRLQSLGQRVDHLFARLQAQRPQARLARDRERLAHLHHRLLAVLRERQQGERNRLERLHARLLARHPQQRLPLLRRQLAEQSQRLRHAIARQLERERHALEQTARTLQAVSPLATLERGYAILLDANGNVVRSTSGVEPGAGLQARLADGSLALRVE